MRITASSIKILFLAGVSVNLLIFIAYNFNNSNRMKEPSSLYQVKSSFDDQNTTEEETPGVQFKDPNLAYHILKKLYVFEPYKGEGTQKEEEEMYKPYLGLSINPKYCDEHLEYYVNNPDLLFSRRNIFTGYHPDSHVRSKAIKNSGFDIQKEVGVHRPKEVNNHYEIDLRPDIMVFMTFLEMYRFRKIDTEYSCLAQMSNHIPGHNSFYRKDYAAQSVINYAKTYELRPQCFSFDKFFPKTFLLYQKEQCKDFFSIVNSSKYKKLKKTRKIVYMRKVGFGVHAGKGVFPVDDFEENYLKELYQNGQECGDVQDNNVIQAFIHNPLLIKGRKFDFRMYMLLASTTPLIAFYHDGCLRVSLEQYNPGDGNNTNVKTNSAMAKEKFLQANEQGSVDGKTERELREDHSWTFERLHKYLYEAGLIKDPDWLDNYLRPEFKKAMIHLMRMSQHSFLKRSTVYELYGLDFMLDDNMNLWFIEGNIKPALGGHTEDNYMLKMNMVIDHFEIIFNVLRSRMKRVFFYVNNLIKSGGARMNEDGEVEIPNLNKRREEFQEANRNFIEPEYEISQYNGFSKIIDENYPGVEKYLGFISEECL